jgi:hypothetical protein
MPKRIKKGEEKMSSFSKNALRVGRKIEIEHGGIKRMLESREKSR